MGGDLFFRFFAKLVRMNGCRINAVWPDLAKFCHYGNILLVNLVFDKILNLLWQNFESILAKFWHKFKAIGLNFLVVNGQTLKIYLAIWSLWINETKLGTRKSETNFAWKKVFWNFRKTSETT